MSHPYRQKAPYPVDEPLPLDESSQLRALAALPRFSAKPLSAQGSDIDLAAFPDLSLNPQLAMSSATHLPDQHQRTPLLLLSLFLSDNPSHDFSQLVIQQYLGANSTTLMPRMKTIDMYRKNAKRLTDPAVLFQYAQYMLQTALILDDSKDAKSPLKGLPKDRAKSPLKGTKSPARERTPDGEPDVAALKRELLKEAQVYLKRLADKGYVEAQYLLGDAYSSGAFGKVDNKEAFLLFLAAAKHGHAECAFRTAHCYEEGLGTGRDARKGVEFLRLAAAKNHPAAMYKLGMYSFFARMGLPDNLTTKKMGIKWLERALNVATELTAAAPYELGRIYQTGFKDILIKDDKYALELYAQAAALGHVDAAAILGRRYELGEGVPVDANLSIHYYTRAALGGHPELMLAMCAWYLVGSEPNLPLDEQEAFEWAKRAAACGLAKAQFALANFYDKGIGCDKDAAEAQKWYLQAAENGEEKALARITDREAAARLARRLKKQGRLLNAQEKDCVVM